MSFSNGGYYLPNTGSPFTGQGVTVSTQHPALFAMVCLALGLDTVEQRAKFAVFYSRINLGWSPEDAYNFLIEKAYEIKFGKDGEHTD